MVDIPERFIDNESLALTTTVIVEPDWVTFHVPTALTVWEDVGLSLLPHPTTKNKPITAVLIKARIHNLLKKRIDLVNVFSAL